MSINVVCPGCKKRFTVSDQYAGQEGPCPSCKAKIKIPEKSEDVEVHAPEEFGPKTATGQAVLKPIARSETKVTTTGLVAVIGSAAVVLLMALIIGRMMNGAVPTILLALGALSLGPPLSVGGYSFLRNQELAPFRGGELWLRASICGAVFAILWAVFYYIPPFVFQIQVSEMEMFHFLFLIPPIVAVGASAALLGLDLDFLSGVIHYGLYVLVCILLRLVMGLGVY